MIEQVLGTPVEHVTRDGNDVAQARALGAAHGENWHAIIVGDDVDTQLVTDYLARTAEELRKRAREQRQRERDAASPGTVGTVNGTTPAADSVSSSGVEPEEARRPERDAERQARQEATRFNLELGRAIFTNLSRVRVDEHVLKPLASVEIVGELTDVAMRGAYGFPGWVTETTQRNGKPPLPREVRRRPAGQRLPGRRRQAW